MAFPTVSTKVSFPELEVRLLELWRTERVFERSVDEAKDRPRFVFYEGPPTANGMPHPGHVLTRVMKDVILRHRAMTGWYVPRRAGWDTHGLPVEVEVEKALGISGRPAIEAYGVEAFTHRCIESVFRYIDEWKKMTERVAFWVDIESAYVTFHEPYIESVWWALKTFFDQGLLYQDYKVVWWWPQGGTALSAGEVGQGYKDVEDPSLFVRFPIVGEENSSLLAWTTTPWTLPCHVALAVAADVDYATVRLETGEMLTLAAKLVGTVFRNQESEVVRTRKGHELVGTKYEPPFRYAEPEGGLAFEVVTADFVSLDTGSGIVHVAPAFGEDDFRLRKDKGLGFLQLVRPDGTFAPEVTDFAGRFCKEADRDIIRNLRQRGLLFKEETVTHPYPFCWRRDSEPLIQYARRSWFIKTSQHVERLVANNRAMHWEPEHIQEGRFGEFLKGNVDWALSRERFWGTPLPIWVNDVTGTAASVGSVAEILAKNPRAFDHWDAAKAKDPSLSPHLRVHKPWVDDVTWTEPGEAGVYRRVPDVIDCWFDSGCMPFAQHGYPHKNREAFETEFPADFITEAVDQTRGWFYSLLAISTLLFPERPIPHPFKNCTVLGIITDEKGQKLSKRFKNYKDPAEMFDKFGADAVRWALYSGSVPGQTNKWFEGGASEAIRELLLKAWNCLSFFVTYANIDGWSPRSARPPVAERSELDRWILAELDGAARDVHASLEGYRTHPAARRIEDFLEALSNWYVRRSRGRFWSHADGAGEAMQLDKRAAFATLYECLVDLSRILAPFTPFLAEAMHQTLVRPFPIEAFAADAQRDPQAAAGHVAETSVHLARFPRGDDARRNDALRDEMRAVRDVVALGGRVRATAKLKVRQPLAEAIVVVTSKSERAVLDRHAAMIADELNVEKVTLSEEPAKYVDFQLLPNFRALGPKLGKDVPACKAALSKADGSALHAELAATGKVKVALPDRVVELEPSELEIRLTPKPGFAAASDRGHVVLLDMTLTDALKRKGTAREVVSRLQAARKALDLPFDARVRVTWSAEGELARAIEEHAEHIAGEVLSTAMVRGTPSAAGRAEDVDGQKLTFDLVVA